MATIVQKIMNYFSEKCFSVLRNQEKKNAEGIRTEIINIDKLLF